MSLVQDPETGIWKPERSKIAHNILLVNQKASIGGVRIQTQQWSKDGIRFFAADGTLLFHAPTGNTPVPLEWIE